ncbi:MAG: metallophosphoesterase [Candidatus Brocadiaceae bacterium]|nr:metallophosphoesterase [Candidatus Brocadiaceae bacterium]
MLFRQFICLVLIITPFILLPGKGYSASKNITGHKDKSVRIFFSGHLLHLLKQRVALDIQETINQAQPDMVLFGGDLMFGTRFLVPPITPNRIKVKWDEINRFFEGIKAPVAIVPGNHDVIGERKECIKMLREEFVSNFGVWDQDPIMIPLDHLDKGRKLLILTLNNFGPLNSKEHCNTMNQDALHETTHPIWAKSKLALSKAPKDWPVIIITHYRVWEHPSWKKVALPDLKGREVIVLSGDQASLEEFKNDNIRYFGCGSTEHTFHYLDIRVGAQGFHVDKITNQLLYPEEPRFLAYPSIWKEHAINFIFIHRKGVVLSLGILCIAVFGVGFCFGKRKRKTRSTDYTDESY